MFKMKSLVMSGREILTFFLLLNLNLTGEYSVPGKIWKA